MDCVGEGALDGILDGEQFIFLAGNPVEEGIGGSGFPGTGGADEEQETRLLASHGVELLGKGMGEAQLGKGGRGGEGGREPQDEALTAVGGDP